MDCARRSLSTIMRTSSSNVRRGFQPNTARALAASPINTSTSAGRIYWEESQGGAAALKSPPPHMMLPAAYTVFPDELFQAPRHWVKTAYHKLVYYNVAEKGGHFAAWEVPEVFAGEMRAAFGSLR